MVQANKELVEINGRVLTLSNLDKMMWPAENITKAHMIKYYVEMAPYLLPYIYNRPLVMKRYPDGIEGGSFYQKECPDYAPEWVETFAVHHTRKVVKYIICNDTATLAWMAGQGCIEIHGWLSRLDNIENPDFAVIDLDPGEGVSFKSVKRVSLIVRETLGEFGITGFPKTSGSSGMHIFIPLEPEYSYARVTAAMKYLAGQILRLYPGIVTIERSKAKRKGKVYIDYLQNGRGKTMAFPYSLRPLPGAPVSTPLTWEEVGNRGIYPGRFNIFNIKDRLAEAGDPYKNIFSCKQDISVLIKQVSLNRKAFSGVDYVQA